MTRRNSHKGIPFRNTPSLFWGWTKTTTTNQPCFASLHVQAGALNALYLLEICKDLDAHPGQSERYIESPPLIGILGPQLYQLSHRIHVWYIYGIYLHLGHLWVIYVGIHIPAPWILWVWIFRGRKTTTKWNCTQK